METRHWLRNNWLELLLLGVLLLALAWLASIGRDVWQTVRPEPTPAPPPATAPAWSVTFDGQRAAGVVSFLAALGPRTAGSEALAVAAERIEQELRDSGWQVQTQTFDLEGVARRNIVASAGNGPGLLLATHYDTSPVADLDPNSANHGTPGPSANDGGSGAAVLLELARVLDRSRLAGQVWLVFLDGQYSNAGDPAATGAQALADAAPWSDPPQAAILLDLLGAADQRFAVDPASDAQLSQQLWNAANQVGLAQFFVEEPGAAIELGQTALAQQGIPAAVIAGSDYPHWRTMLDTPEQIDPASLARVGRLLQAIVTQ